MISLASSKSAPKGAKPKKGGGLMAAQALAKQKSLEKRAKKYKLPMRVNFMTSCFIGSHHSPWWFRRCVIVQRIFLCW